MVKKRNGKAGVAPIVLIDEGTEWSTSETIGGQDAADTVKMDRVQFLKNALFKIAFVAVNRKYSEEGEEISEAEALDYIQMTASDALRYFK